MKKYKFITFGGSLDTFEIARKIHKRRSHYKGTALVEDLRGPRQVDEVDGTGDERFQNNCA